MFTYRGGTGLAGVCTQLLRSAVASLLATGRDSLPSYDAIVITVSPNLELPNACNSVLFENRLLLLLHCVLLEISFSPQSLQSAEQHF